MATWVIVGSNRGIGLEITRQVHARGDDVVAVCRHTSDELEELSVTTVTGVDITSEDDVARLRSRLRAPRGPVACDAIAVHVRLGDFVAGPALGEPVSATNQRLPVDWYVDAVTAIRAALGAQRGCVVYADGADEDLAPLLSLPATSRARAAGALDDILAIAAARVIVGSNSTFSMWSAYLGQRPSLWYPGARQSRLNADPALEPEYYGGALPARFAEAIRS